MTNQPSTTGVNASAPNVTREQREGRQILLKDIGDKWNKFSKQELDSFKDSHDLVAQVVAKYGLDKADAQRDVDGVIKGRAISV
jgi:hypothetical protein